MKKKAGTSRRATKKTPRVKKTPKPVPNAAKKKTPPAAAKKNSPMTENHQKLNPIPLKGVQQEGGMDDFDLYPIGSKIRGAELNRRNKLEQIEGKGEARKGSS
jgi:hypothetical protein